MTIGIYKITNIINQKSYIGQSRNIERRIKDHYSIPKSNTILYSAMSKYGVENFKWEILKECLIEELNEVEIEKIKEFDTLSPNGYNMTRGGDCNRAVTKLSNEEVIEIKDKLLNSEITIEDIAREYNVWGNTIYSINNGLTWVEEEEKYPIRKKQYQTDKKTRKRRKIIVKKSFCLQCGIEISNGTKNNLCQKCYCKTTRKVERPTKEVLNKNIWELGFTGTGKLYGVSDNAIKRWCIDYGMSKYIKDYKAPKKKTTPIEHILKNEITVRHKSKEEDLTFNSGYEFCDFIEKQKITKGSRESIETGVRRLIKGKHKSYLGYILK